MFSEAEHERRWNQTRQRMAAASLDVLVLAPSSGSANQRYLSGASTAAVPAAVVFPSAGEPTVLASEAVPCWIRDVRIRPNHELAAAVAERLGELHLDRGSLGITNLDDAPFGLVRELGSRLPDVRLVDATALLTTQRSIMSAEELALIEQAARAVEKSVLMLTHYIHAGMRPEKGLGLVAAALLEAGCDPGFELRWSTAAQPDRTAPSSDWPAVARGDLIEVKVQAAVGGYGTFLVHPISIGKPRDQYQQMFDVAAQLLGDWLANPAPSAPSPAAEYRCSLDVFEAGLSQTRCDRPAAAGQAVNVRVSVRSPDGPLVLLAETVLITAGAAQRLGTRPLQMLGTHRSFLNTHLPAELELPPWSPERTARIKASISTPGDV